MKVPETPPTAPKNFNYKAVLDDLTRIGKFDEFFEVDNSKYPYWDKWKYIAKEWNYNSEKLWAAVQSNRLGKLLFFSDFIFRINTPSIIQQYLHEFDLNLGGSLHGESIIPDNEKDRFLISSLMEEAIASSQLEGAVTTRKVAKEMLESNRKPGNLSEQMILNNYEGMKWIVRNKDVPFTPDNILQLHAIITRNTLSEQTYVGAFRRNDEVNVVDVQTGNVVYQPPSFKKLAKLMNEFCKFANDKDKPGFFIHPVSRGIVLHFLIGYIHPFVDGNGRTARTLFYWYLLKKDYALIEYMSVSKVILNARAQYARAFLYTEIDNNDLTYFILYNLQCMKNALEELKKYVQRKTSEMKNVMALLHNTKFNERQCVLLQELLQGESTYYSVGQVEKWFKVSNQTARNDLNELVEAGLLEHRKAGKKIQFFPVRDFKTKIGKEK